MLSGVTAEQIDRAVDVWDSRYPPNALEFKAICKPMVHAAHSAARIEHKPERNPEAAKAFFATMRGK